MEDSAPKERPTLTANELRRLAEAVDGFRDQPVYLVWTSGGAKATTERPSDDDLILECNTNNVNQSRPILPIGFDPPVTDSQGAPIENFFERYDALFWSEAAIGKFVLPYYIGFNPPEFVARIRNAFNREDVYAMAHPVDTWTVFLTSIRTAGKGLEALTLEEIERLP